MFYGMFVLCVVDCVFVCACLRVFERYCVLLCGVFILGCCVVCVHSCVCV